MKQNDDLSKFQKWKRSKTTIWANSKSGNEAKRQFEQIPKVETKQNDNLSKFQKWKWSPIQIILVFLKGKTTTIRRDESLPRATFRLCDVTSCYEEVFYPQCRNSESFFKRKMKKILIPIKRLFLARNFLSSAKIYLVNCSKWGKD